MANENGGDVSERVEDLIHSIEQDEEILLEAVHELAEATEQKLDVAQYIRTYPMTWLAGAFCAGLWLGMGSSPDIGSRSAITDYRRIR